MIEEKTITLNDLKYYYGERQGFIFQGATPSSPDAIERMCSTLVSKEFAEKMPEFFTRINANTIAVVFPEGASFKSGDFYKIGKNAEMLGFFKIDVLGAWLRVNVKN
jgi:hypothetical protein